MLKWQRICGRTFIIYRCNVPSRTQLSSCSSARSLHCPILNGAIEKTSHPIRQSRKRKEPQYHNAADERTQYRSYRSSTGNYPHIIDAIVHQLPCLGACRSRRRQHSSVRPALPLRAESEAILPSDPRVDLGTSPHGHRRARTPCHTICVFRAGMGSRQVIGPAARELPFRPSVNVRAGMGEHDH